MTRPICNSMKKHTNIAKKIKLENSDDNCIDAVEQWGKKEKPSKHLKSKSFRPFKTESLKTQIPVGDVVCVLDSPSQSPKHSRCSMNNTIIKSSSTPFNQTTIGCTPEKELYDNGLPKDLMYYQKMVLPDGTLKNDYIVDLYGYIYEEKKCDVLTDLDFREFDTLSENQWLSNFVIDICLATYLVKIGSPNVKILSTNTVRLLMMKRDYGEEYDEKIKVSNNNIILMPWRVNDNHWILIVINVDSKMFTIMDPLNTNERIKMIRFREVHRVLSSNFIYIDGNKLPRMSINNNMFENVPEQTDGSNCGVFILYYAFTIMNKKCFDSTFDPVTYSTFLKKYLLENSEDMTNVCLYCGWNSNKHRPDIGKATTDWVCCESCFRWVAQQCIFKDKNKTLNFDIVEFKCLLCKGQRVNY